MRARLISTTAGPKTRKIIGNSAKAALIKNGPHWSGPYVARWTVTATVNSSPASHRKPLTSPEGNFRTSTLVMGFEFAPAYASCLARLIYSAITSLNGYVADKDGKFDWAAPDEEVHAFVNDLERDIGTHLYGRRMYEVMAFWETAHTLAGEPPVFMDYAQIWQAADKVVYSRTLRGVTTARTKLEREFDPDAVREMKAQAGRDISVGGPHLAAEAIKAGLVDEYHLLIAPVVVGGGNQALPDTVRVHLELLDERRFHNGVVHLHYRTRKS